MAEKISEIFFQLSWDQSLICIWNPGFRPKILYSFFRPIV